MYINLTYRMLRRKRDSKKKDKRKNDIVLKCFRRDRGSTAEQRDDGSAEDGISYGKSLPMGS